MRFSALLLWLCLPGLAAAQGPAAQPPAGPVARKVLALYSRENIPGDHKDIAFTQLHQRGEMPLNYLGVELVYHDASKPLPDPATLSGYRGVLTWFEKPVNFEDPSPVCRWLSAAMRARLWVVMLGDPGVYTRSQKGAPDLPADCADMFRALGLKLTGSRVVDPFSIETQFSHPRMMGFERKPDLLDAGVVPLARLLPGATSYLRLGFLEGNIPPVDPVALTRRGAFALHPFFLYTNGELNPPQYRWIVDPFAFFEAAFRLQGLPRPDVTTMNGRRVYMTHVDGDGFFNRSELDPKKWSGEVFLREFVDPHPESPFTLSLMTGYYDLSLYSDKATLALTRDMMNRPNVEPSSHGYAHPLDWRLRKVALSVPGYTMDSRREIVGSAEQIDKIFLGGGRRTALFQWTGDCLPSEQEVLMAERAGLLNINGGGGRFDSRFPSYSYVQPLSRLLGSARQIYAPISNEIPYTNLWTGAYYGYRDAIESYERTENPRRIRPVSVYVHYYSAEKFAALESLRKVYAWVHARPLFPVWTGRWVRSVRGFFELGIERLPEGGFRFRGGADLRTVRFDSESRVPDLALSKGVVGFRRERGALYVFFDENEPRELRFSSAPGAPYLSEANFEVSRWRRTPHGIGFLKNGWWKGELVLGGLGAGLEYEVRSGEFAARIRADGRGFLKVLFPDSERGGPPRPVSVEPA